MRRFRPFRGFPVCSTRVYWVPTQLTAIQTARSRWLISKFLFLPISRCSPVEYRDIAICQRAFVLNHRRIVHGGRTISMSIYDRKGESCVLSSAKIMFFFRIIVQCLKKKFGFFEYCPLGSKSSGLSFEIPLLSLPTSLFLLRTSQLSWKTSQFSRSTSPLSYRISLPYRECNAFFSLVHFVCSSATRIGAFTRTRAPTSRTHRVLNFCLHPSPSPLTDWKSEWYVWSFRPFYPSPGEHDFLFIFTFNFLIISILSSLGEEVKVKNGKRRTRAYARALAIRMW